MTLASFLKKEQKKSNTLVKEKKRQETKTKEHSTWQTKGKSEQDKTNKSKELFLWEDWCSEQPSASQVPEEREAPSPVA